MCSNENEVLLNWHAQVHLFSCHSQAISACAVHHTGFSLAGANWPSQLLHSRCLSLPAYSMSSARNLRLKSVIGVPLRENKCFPAAEHQLVLQMWWERWSSPSQRRGNWFCWWTDFCLLMTCAGYANLRVLDSPWQSKNYMQKENLSVHSLFLLSLHSI